MIFSSQFDQAQWRIRVQRGEGPGGYPKRAWRPLEAAQRTIEQALSGQIEPSAEDAQRWVEANAHTVTR